MIPKRLKISMHLTKVGTRESKDWRVVLDLKLIHSTVEVEGMVQVIVAYSEILYHFS